MQFSKIILIVVLNLFYSLGNAQNESKEIRESFFKFHKLLDKKDYEKAFDYFHTSFLKVAPKSSLSKELEEMNSSTDFTFFTTNMKIEFISSIQKNKEIKYAYFNYSGKTHIKFNKNTNLELIEILKQNIKDAYGEDYSYSDSKMEIIFLKRTESIAINDNGWKFIPYTDKLRWFITTIVPEKVLLKIIPK